jgi:hypothetical protein
MTLITVIRPALVFFSRSYTHDFGNSAYLLVNLDQVVFWRRKRMVDLAMR